MPQVRVRDKCQITLPSAVVRAANIGKDDVLDVTYKDGVITLITQRSLAQMKPSLMALAGSTTGLYGKDTQARQQYVTNERASWTR